MARAIVRVAAVIAVGFAVLPASASADPPPNRLSPMNPSFRSGTEGWDRSGGTIAAYSNWSFDGDGASLEVKGTPTNNDVSAFSGFVPVTQNEAYSARVSAWVVTAIQGFHVRIEWWNATSPMGASTGPTVTGTGATTGSVTGTAPSGATRARLRIFDSGTGTWHAYLDAAIVVAGAAPSTFYFTPDSAPYATVRDANNRVLARFGSAYATQPGGQIQLAENYASCNDPAGCPHEPTTGIFPQVILDSGTFPVWTAVTACDGIIAYPFVRLAGSGGTEISLGTTSNSCPNTLHHDLYSVVHVMVSPAHPNLAGHSLDVSNLTINVGHRAHTGLAVGRVSGPGLSVNGIRVNSADEAGIFVGDLNHPVSGVSGSPAMVTNNTVWDTIQDGIILGGSYITASGNTVTGSGDHGIAIYHNTVNHHVRATDNTVNHAYVGISLDGSEVVADSLSVDANIIRGVCVGVFAYRAQHSNIAGNNIADPRQSTGCSDFHWSVGVAVKDSSHNYLWSNYSTRYVVGYQIRDTGRSPSGVGTRFNQFGVTPASGTPAAGNWVDNATWGFYVDGANSATNYFDANSVTNSVMGCRSETAQAVGSRYANSFPNCPLPGT